MAGILEMDETREFTLHPQLAADTVAIGDLPLGRVLLMNDCHYPWCLLVPRRAGTSELYELDADALGQLSLESASLGRIMMAHFRGDKLNVAALGNVVPQLHVHHIVRYRNDPAWPAPVWGRVPTRPYLPADLERERRSLADLLASAHSAHFVRAG